MCVVKLCYAEKKPDRDNYITSAAMITNTKQKPNHFLYFLDLQGRKEVNNNKE